MLKVVIKEPNKKPYVKEIEDELSVYQDIVGGYIEVFLFGDCLAICNEEGKFNDLAPNFPLYSARTGEMIDMVVGNVIFINEGEDGDFASLNDEQVERILKSL